METIEDILREMRVYIDECNRGVTPHTRYGNGAFPLDDLADRIDAAHKREIADALDTGAFVAEAKKQAVTDCNGLNGAKCREALESIANNLENRLFSKYPCSATDVWMLQKARSALSEPPRNCDLPTVIADPHGVWLKDRDNWDEFGNPEKEIYDWLLAEAKGETK